MMRRLCLFSMATVVLEIFVCSFALAEDLNQVGVLIKQAEQFEQDDKLAEAEEALNQAVALDPLLAHPYYFRAMFLREKRGDLQGARRDLLEATRLRPNDRQFKDELCETAVRLGDLPLVEKLVKQSADPELTAKSIVRLIPQTIGGRLSIWRQSSIDRGSKRVTNQSTSQR